MANGSKAAKSLLMLAAENAALPGGKVGGMGDVVRDVPVALAELGWSVTILTPDYGTYTAAIENKVLATINVEYGGAPETLTLHELLFPDAPTGIRQLVLKHDLFVADTPGRIYVDDGADAPFATDATRFALFCLGAAESLHAGAIEIPSVVHLHDWHAALFLALCRYHVRYKPLADVKNAYTIHNLAIQGIRPLVDDASSFNSWFPGIAVTHDELKDPRWTDCVNPMAVGIRLADKVHVVSPSYAKEIVKPSSIEDAYFGGEGLEVDLQNAKNDGRLIGILNGCYYEQKPEKPAGWQNLWQQISEASIAGTNDAIRKYRERPNTLLTSVGRTTAQKLKILRHKITPDTSVLDELLTRLGDDNLFVLLGSGEPGYEVFLEDAAARHGNFMYLNGYFENVADALYEEGDLFVMPSSYEPCGISQMIAMRAGQPCIVHGVGGLKDTVCHNENGFVFQGAGLQEQSRDFLSALGEALNMQRTDPERWSAIGQSAADARFEWSTSVVRYETELYGCSA